MADLAKLASLSKKLKTSKPKVNEDESALTGPVGGGGASGDGNPGGTPAPAAHPPANSPTPAASPTSAPVASGGGAAPKVTVNVDLEPVKDMLGRIRDEMKNLREEIKKTREKGMKVELGDDSSEQMDQVLKHLSTVSKAGRELTEKLVTSLPESRWYGDLLKTAREAGENVAGGGGGGSGGGSSEEITEIKEQLEMQKSQLTAILSILKRR